MSAKVVYLGSVSPDDSIALVIGTKAEILASKPRCFALGNPSDSTFPMGRIAGGEWYEFQTVSA